MADWLDELPEESGLLLDVALEDEIDEVALDRALRESRGEVTLPLDDSIELDQQGYEEALRDERRGVRPPSLRQAATEEVSCNTCSHFDNGICGLFTYKVSPDDVCDEWESAD